MQDLVQIPIDEEKSFDGLVFPLTLSPAETKAFGTVEDAVRSLKANMDGILDKLVKHGAILFRGFSIACPSDFNQVALAFGWNDLPYIGGAAVRTNVVGVVFTA